MLTVEIKLHQNANNAVPSNEVNVSENNDSNYIQQFKLIQMAINVQTNEAITVAVELSAPFYYSAS